MGTADGFTIEGAPKFEARAVQRRIVREEPHLREIFEPAYERYASRTARLLPGVY